MTNTKQNIANELARAGIVPGARIRYYVLEGYKTTNEGTIRSIGPKGTACVLENGTKFGHHILISRIAEVI